MECTWLTLSSTEDMDLSSSSGGTKDMICRRQVLIWQKVRVRGKREGIMGNIQNVSRPQTHRTKSAWSAAPKERWNNYLFFVAKNEGSKGNSTVVIILLSYILHNTSNHEAHQRHHCSCCPPRRRGLRPLHPCCSLHPHFLRLPCCS